MQIVGVVPGPRLVFDAAAPSSSGTQRTTIYRGYVRLAEGDSRMIVRPGDLEALSFFVPDSAEYPQPPALLAVETSLRTIRTRAQPSLVSAGAYAAQVAVVPDPRGNGQQWLQVSFQTPIASLEAVEINYCVTVQG